MNAEQYEIELGLIVGRYKSLADLAATPGADERLIWTLLDALNELHWEQYEKICADNAKRHEEERNPS